MANPDQARDERGRWAATGISKKAKVREAALSAGISTAVALVTKDPLSELVAIKEVYQLAASIKRSFDK